LCIAKTKGGPDQVAAAVIHANALPQLVSYLSDSDLSPNLNSNSIHQVLTRYSISLLAYILSFRQTWQPALCTPIIPLLIARLSESLSNPDLGPRIDATCALANITDAEGGKHTATHAGAVPLLVQALASPSHDVVKMAVRALRNITSIDIGKRAVYTADAVQPLVALLDLRQQADHQVRYDAVKALASMASGGRVVRRKIREQGAVEKVKALPNRPSNLKKAAEDLRDDLRGWV
jgi:HEAT repeat protein